MAAKRVTYYTYGDDQQCAETKKFIQDAGIVLEVRNLEEKPLTAAEATAILGHYNPHHFLNPASESYSKNGLDTERPPINELAEMIAADHTLLRRPIIKTSRLTTIGCDKKNLTSMLLLNSNGQEQHNRPRERRNDRHDRNDRNDRGDRNDRRSHAPTH